MQEKRVHFSNDVSCVLCGAAGQGIQTIENILPPLMKLSGYHVFATKEYMSRVRGGSNSTEIRVASQRVNAYVDRVDILVPLDKDAIPHLKNRISTGTMIIGDRGKLYTERELIDVPFSKIAKEIGSAIYENIVAVGVISGIFGLEKEKVSNYIKKYFGAKKKDVVANNIRAFARGYDIGSELRKSGKVKIDIKVTEGIEDEILLAGSEAVGLGAIAGGCNFISAYPMTPSTGVFTFLAQHGDDFGIIAEQAEDEIAAMNMQLGAWYAGGRAMVTTSGGGFALMVEAVSLAGMIESPAVIYLGQRPGPATGLPTRTEQGELEFALYSGHGEFPRIILAPGTIEDAFSLTHRAFSLADKYQVPVFVLSDQLLADSLYNLPAPDISGLSIEKHIVKTDTSYMRYRIAENRISPRGIPGYGEGFVGIDSDEHDEEGHITESMEVRVNMVEKRLGKLDLIKKDILPPKLFGDKDYDTLVVGWGSTFGAIKEAVEKIGSPKLAFLHVNQVYPLHQEIADSMKRAKRTVVVENNATSQFGKLVKVHLGIEADGRILKYNGLPFSVEELVEKISREGKV